ncbi:MAG: ABC transporter ATP-binding protein [Acholeplasmataceae bacterium]|nr:ABC transporter ATP-binding protein [Acholeplasmataceae bacterium]
MAILEIKDLIVDYGIIRALKGITMTVNEGSIVAVLGANGAGKTTTIRTISGAVKAKSGQILYDGEDMTNKDPHIIARKGILQSPEGRMILNGLTVEENLKVGAYGLKTLKTDHGTQRVAEQIRDHLMEVYQYFPILNERKKQQASTLSGGEQQMLAIGRALMGHPKLLLLDEPSLGLAPMIVRDIFQIIKQIKESGRTILLVEQNAYQTLKIADYVYVLELGKIKTQGTGAELMKDESLVNAYLGSKH